MKMTRTAALAGALSLGIGLGAVQAQTADRVWDTGSVWQVSRIETKPGMFNQYMAYLNGPWRQIQEARRKSGQVLSYKILSLVDVRDGEPDLMLMVELKNMAVLDESPAEADRVNAAVFGSGQAATQSQISREAMRTQRGQLLMRELKFK